MEINMKDYDVIKFTQNEKGLFFQTIENQGGRADIPRYSQKTQEKEVTKIHQICKGSSLYLASFIDYQGIDWYESCDSFEVPSAKYVKGSRRVTNTSDTSNDTPKAWLEMRRIHFKFSQRNKKQIELCLKASGISIELAKDVQKMIKRNDGVAYISEEYLGMNQWKTALYGALKVVEECDGDYDF
jgi:hypothetical protein